MYVHVRKAGDLDFDPDSGDPLTEIAARCVTLVHSECFGGEMSVEEAGTTLTLVCGKCATRQELARDEATEALSRVLAHDEYAWGGDAGFLPD